MGTVIVTAPKRPIVRYHGGKWKLAPWITSHFPAHRVYVEPFGGGGSVLIRKPRSYAEVYNDLDHEIVNVFRVARDRGAELQRALELTPFSRDDFILSYEPADDPLEQARRTIARSFMGFGSAAACGEISGFRANSSRSGTTPVRLYDEGKSFPGAWRYIPSATSSNWRKRAETAARYARPGDVVADVGCGPMMLERYLPTGCTYVPIDIAPRDERTIVIDLNSDELPEFQADVTYCLGILEYLFNPESVLRQLSERSTRLVVSFMPHDDDAIEDRRARCWASHHTSDEFEALLKETGWSIQERPVIGGDRQLLWYCRRALRLVLPSPTRPAPAEENQPLDADASA